MCVSVCKLFTVVQKYNTILTTLYCAFKDLFIMQNIVSVQFSHSVVSNSLPPHEPQHTRPPHPSPIPGVDSGSCPLSWWFHPTISSSVVPFSSCLQSLPASGSFQMSQLFALGGQSIGVSASASILPMNIQDWVPLGWTGWISLKSKGLQDSSPTLQFKSINSLALPFFTVQLSHPYMTTGKTKPWLGASLLAK